MSTAPGKPLFNGNIFALHGVLGDAKNCDIFHVEVCPTIPFSNTV
jgi:hypothetical protein